MKLPWRQLSFWRHSSGKRKPGIRRRAHKTPLRPLLLCSVSRSRSLEGRPEGGSSGAPSSHSAALPLPLTPVLPGSPLPSAPLPEPPSPEGPPPGTPPRTLRAGTGGGSRSSPRPVPPAGGDAGGLPPPPRLPVGPWRARGSASSSCSCWPPAGPGSRGAARRCGKFSSCDSSGPSAGCRTRRGQVRGGVRPARGSRCRWTGARRSRVSPVLRERGLHRSSCN